MLDDKYRDYYSLRAGLHCQSVVADRTSRALKDSSFSVYTLAPLYGGTEGTPLVCWVLKPVCEPLRSATIILMSGRTLNKKELALHIHCFLALEAKSYNDTA